MTDEIETSIKTEAGVRVSVNEWDDGGVWLHLSMRSGTAYTSMTKDVAQQLLAGLQAILAKEVTA
jgi:predicted SpoU family rRNA methylase